MLHTAPPLSLQHVPSLRSSSRHLLSSCHACIPLGATYPRESSVECTDTARGAGSGVGWRGGAVVTASYGGGGSASFCVIMTASQLRSEFLESQSRVQIPTWPMGVFRQDPDGFRCVFDFLSTFRDPGTKVEKRRENRHKEENVTLDPLVLARTFVRLTPREASPTTHDASPTRNDPIRRHDSMAKTITLAVVASTSARARQLGSLHSVP